MPNLDPSSKMNAAWSHQRNSRPHNDKERAAFREGEMVLTCRRICSLYVSLS